MKKYFILITITTFLGIQNIKAQTPDLDGNSTLGQDIDENATNTITTAVPFLLIAPDSRSGAMGDVGVAISPDANSLHWNPAKYAFIDKDMGMTFSYIPWLRSLVDDINLAYLSGFKKIDDNQVFAGSLLYFTLGNITFTDNTGATIGTFDPHELTLDMAYARKFSKKYSMGLAARYIHSNLTGGKDENGTTHPGRSFAMDISAYYNDDIEIADYDSKLAFGLNISNIGSKISYTDGEKNFIPINLRLGTALTTEIDEYNKITVAIDLNKYLVPTPAIWYTDTVLDEQKVLYGRDPNVSVPVGMLQSFYDAPGVIKSDGSRNVFKEELREITYSIGLEYWYANQFAIRTGYFYEHATKGNRKYLTAGFGLKLNVFGLDFSYLFPTGTNNSPLANTLRFSIIFDFDSFSTQ